MIRKELLCFSYSHADFLKQVGVITFRRLNSLSNCNNIQEYHYFNVICLRITTCLTLNNL